VTNAIRQKERKLSLKSKMEVDGQQEDRLLFDQNFPQAAGIRRPFSRFVKRAAMLLLGDDRRRTEVGRETERSPRGKRRKLFPATRQ